MNETRYVTFRFIVFRFPALPMLRCLFPLRACVCACVCGVTYIIGGYLLECNMILRKPYFLRCKLVRLQGLYIRWLLR